MVTEIEKGTLYLVGTPIGNLEDITMRAISTLQMVDLVAAEDTRHTIKLFNHFKIQTELTSYHEHNKISKGPKLVEMLKEGKSIALVSDAGMPGISDPGTDLVEEVVKQGLKIVPIPGPSAGITALVASGLRTDKFTFFGFLDRDKKARRGQVEEIKAERSTLVLYEAPHRLKATLKDLGEALSCDRKVVVARELTKKYEEFVRGTIEEVNQHFQNNEVKGEFVILIEGNKEEVIDHKWWSTMSIVEHTESLMKQGLSNKEAMKQVALQRGISKREVYQSLLEVKNG